MVKMSQSSQSRVQVTIELGHTACIRKKLTPEGFTHDWSVFVRGPDGSKIQHFIEKVVFNLHDTFSKPKRTVKEPPYQVSESGYASFLLPIDIYFRNKELPKKISFQYDLYLNAEGGPPINHTRCEKLTFQNPTEEFRQKLLKAGGVQFTSSNSQQPFTELFGTPITPDTGNKRPAGSTSSGKDKSTKGKSSSKPSTPQSSHAASTVSSSSSSSMGGPATQPIASKEPKTSKSSSSSSSSTRETTGQKRPSISSPEQTSGKKMKRSSSTSSTTESSSSKHKSHKSSSKKKSDSEKSSKRKSSSSKHHKDKSEHKERKKKDKSESSGSHSKSSSSLSRSMPELKLKTELLSPLHDSPPRSLSPPHTKPDILDSNSDSDSNFSPKHIPPSPKDSPISSLSEDEEEMTRKILAGKAEDDSSSNSSKSYNEQGSVKPVSDSDSDSNDDVKSTHSETKSQSFSHMSPKVSKNSSDSHKLSPVKTESKSSPVKSESKSSKSKHVSSKKSSSSKSEPKSKDTKDSKDKKERSESSSSSKHSRSNKDSKTSKEKKDKESSQNENGIPDKAPNGESIKELLDLQVTLCRMTDRRKLQLVANLIGPTGLFKVTETSFSFDLCNLESDIVKKIKTVLSESLS